MVRLRQCQPMVVAHLDLLGRWIGRGMPHLVGRAGLWGAPRID
ncbi:hypothetical protein [uncultured Roseibium sp.]|nr:hypothetical protein [uncultured Roseibium sp.]